MIKIIYIFLFLSVSFQTLANGKVQKGLVDDLICAYEEAVRVKGELGVELITKDKYLHCTVSCAVGVVCGSTPSAILGIAKEVYDVFGPGHAEIKDLFANIRGLKLSQKVDINDLNSCSLACETFYPY
ncbi:MAG: hypothetical protein ACJAS4_002824 [Bacteriovoracaceae bacterium]|jgi:hypothetical protein